MAGSAPKAEIKRVGLIAVSLSEMFPSLSWLEQADAVAAMIVALIVVYVSVQLGKRTIDDLLDAAPAGLAEAIQQAAEAVPGVADCHAVRIRPSGPRTFIDMHILVDGRLSLEDAHALQNRSRRPSGSSPTTLM